MYHNPSTKRYDALPLSTIELNTNILTDYTPPTEKTAMGEIIFKTLMGGSNLHYADVLPLAVVCKSHGISFSDFKNIVTKVAANDSALRTNKVNLKELYKKGHDTHVTHKKTVALMKRLNCNTWRFNI